MITPEQTNQIESTTTLNDLTETIFDEVTQPTILYLTTTLSEITTRNEIEDSTESTSSIQINSLEKELQTSTDFVTESIETSPETSTEASTEASSETSIETSTEASIEAYTEVSIETSSKASYETSTEASHNSIDLDESTDNLDDLNSTTAPFTPVTDLQNNLISPDGLQQNDQDANENVKRNNSSDFFIDDGNVFVLKNKKANYYNGII